MQLRQNRTSDVQAETDCEMRESTKSNRHSTSEIVAYHKVKRIFLSLKDMEHEDQDLLQICEFKGQDFDLIAE